MKMKSVLFLLMSLALNLALSSFFANAAGVPQMAVPIALGITALSFIPRGVEGLAYDTVSTDLSKIIKYANNNPRTLVRRLYGGIPFAQDVSQILNVKDSIPLPLLVVNGQPRPYTGNFNPNAGDLDFSDRVLTVGKFQRDLLIDPHQFRVTYLNRGRGAGEGANNQTVPYAQVVNEAVIDQNSAMLNLALWNGLGETAFTAFAVGTAYTKGQTMKWRASTDQEYHYYRALTATTAGDTPVSAAAKWEQVDHLAVTRGLGQIMQKDRTDGVIKNVASTGAFTAADALNQALEVYRALPIVVRDSFPDIFFYAPTNILEMVTDAFRDKIDKYTNADRTVTVLPGTDGKCKLKAASWMAGGKAPFCSPMQNLFFGTDQVSDVSDVRAVQDVWKIKYGIAGVVGTNYCDPNAISVADTDLVG